MYKIQANKSGTRHIDISDEHLATIKEYSLFQDLTDSGFADAHGAADQIQFPHGLPSCFPIQKSPFPL